MKGFHLGITFEWQEIRFRIYSPHYAFALFLRDFFPSQRQLRVTVTVRSAFMVTVHAFPDVESHADQLPNVEPLLGVAVSVTVVPSTKCAVHVPVDGPQSMPTGTLVTTPLPLPVGTTSNVGKLTGPTTREACAVIREWFTPCKLKATIVVSPKPVAVASPEGLMVATPVSLDCHVTSLVMSCVAGLCVKWPMAVY